MKHDFTKPFTEEEKVGLKAVFVGLPTFTPDSQKGHILSSAQANWFEAIGYDRSEEQIAAYKQYWDRFYGGIIPYKDFIETTTRVHDSADVLKVRVTGAYDKEGTGYISVEELMEFSNIAVIHEPKFEGADFQGFVDGAKKTEEGKVSLEEFGNWMTETLGK